jgi:hypothetical protein
MAKRSTRRLITDRLEQAAKYCEDAQAKLAEVQAIYFDGGYEIGAELDMIDKSLTMTKAAITRFRKERA